jgi:hypothetical protein
MYDLLVSASSRQNIEIKKNQRCFSPDVCHSHHRTISLADLRIHTQGFTADSGQCCQLYPLNVCPDSQNKAWIRMLSGVMDIWNYVDLNCNFGLFFFLDYPFFTQ